GLQQLFTQLLAAGLVTKEELEDRLLLSQSSVIVDIQKERLPLPEGKKPVIDASDALNCIRSGMDDAALMKRYSLSIRGVHSLFEKLIAAKVISREEIDLRGVRGQQSFILDEEQGRPPPPTKALTEIDSEEVLHSLKSGTTPSDVIEQYDIARTDLDTLLDTLVQRGVITESERQETLQEPSEYFEITNRFSGKLIYSGEAPSLAALLESAVRGGVDLSESDLSGANLSRAVLSGALLNRADLSQANLIRADLTGARLAEADLVSANVTGAVLYKANLAGANLSDSNLSLVDARWAFLKESNLSETNLTNADLSGANLSGAQMFETTLTGAVINGAYRKTPTTEPDFL
ncbi:MAG: pentapeptide repeat-containing protein, partial [Deltaproteobacteria bacterium]|nr:pentapeptide repeat-containing protein [Deltaproteobacteria bacterium]